VHIPRAGTPSGLRSATSAIFSGWHSLRMSNHDSGWPHQESSRPPPSAALSLQDGACSGLEPLTGHPYPLAVLEGP
jgi:hypothetical protein